MTQPPGSRTPDPEPRTPDPEPRPSWLRLWFTFGVAVDRGTYLRHGFGLALVKYLIDAGAVWLAYGVWWTPVDYLNPFLLDRAAQWARGPDWFAVAMAVWTLPFLWIGVSMTLRRAVNAGFGPWSALLFFVPFVNYGLMIALSVARSREPLTPQRAAVTEREAHQVRSALLGVAAGLAIALVMTGLSVWLFKSYGWTLFVGTPVAFGATTAFIHNHEHARPLGDTMAVVAVMVLVAGGTFLLFALEGLVCIAMAAPLALALAMLGAVLGRTIAVRFDGRPAQALPVLLILPISAGAESVAPSTPVYETTTAVDIAAPPEVVWQYVVDFGELPPPKEWVLRTGIAYPVRARLEGTGVGAVRHCEFTTGAFVEPITHWEPGVRLSFDVASQPPAMRELSPYSEIHPPHLDGFMRSQRGEFRLVRLPGGGTRLEGSTWYQLEIYPQWYWRLFADVAIRAIHARVLTFVKERAEAAYSG